MKRILQQAVPALVNLAVFTGVLAAVCLLIHPWLPIPDVEEVQPKLEYLKLHADDYDTLFIGTSHIYRHIIPHQFDELTALAGIPTKSFNAAVDGMRPPEDAYFLDEVLKFHPTHLRWVFVEANPVRIQVDPLKRDTNREVYWHDWNRLKLLCREAFDFDMPHHPHGIYRALEEPLPIFLEHLGSFFANMSNAGRGAVLSERLANAPGTSFKALGENLDGFREIGDRQSLSENDRKDFEEAVAERREEPAHPNFGSDPSQDAIWQIIRKIQALGATPILIVPPLTEGKSFYPRPRDGQKPIILDFANLVRYPELYEERYRCDKDHLNTPGAVLFTRLLAERFEEVAKAAKWADPRFPAGGKPGPPAVPR